MKKDLDTLRKERSDLNALCRDQKERMLNLETENKSMELSL